MLGLCDPVIALDFDNAAAMRLLQFEDERNAAFFGYDKPEAKVTFETIH